MAEDDNIPLTEEYLEANQFYLDKRRYELVSKLTPEEQEAFKKMENAVEILVGTNRPFVLSAAPTKDDRLFWQYHKFSQEKFPFSEEEGNKIMQRAFYAFRCHAATFAKMTGHQVQIQSPDGKPLWLLTDKDEQNLLGK
jgi:hypothetical protein